MKTKYYRFILLEVHNWIYFFIFIIPGLLGNLFRRYYLKLYLKSTGKKLNVESFVKFTGLNNISLGSNCSISFRSTLFAHSDGSILIGDNFSMNYNSCINSAEGGQIIIGNNVLIAQNVVLRASDHNFENINISINQQGHNVGRIIIEDDCWIAANAIITSNVIIGSHSIVGAGAVVTSNVEPYSIVGGVPAKLIRNRKKNLAS